MTIQQEAIEALPFVEALAAGKIVQWKGRYGFNLVSTLLELFEYDEDRQRAKTTLDKTLRIKPTPEELLSLVISKLDPDMSKCEIQKLRDELKEGMQ